MFHEITTNNMIGRRKNSIDIRDSGEHGGYYFISLQTGKEIHGLKWDILPIYFYAISTLEKIAEE